MATPIGTSRKAAWQRNKRRQFVAEHGFSTSANYSDGGLREQVLERGGRRCVKCGMTDAEHRTLWGRPITVDHKDKNRQHNTLDNLQTLCLRCHGRKDILPRLTVPRVPQHRAEILARRARNQSYQRIANDLGFSIAAIWKWVQRWSQEERAA